MPLTPLGYCYYQIDLRSLKSVDNRSHVFTCVSHLCSSCDALWHDQLTSRPRESHNVTERACGILNGDRSTVGWPKVVAVQQHIIDLSLLISFAAIDESRTNELAFSGCKGGT